VLNGLPDIFEGTGMLIGLNLDTIFSIVDKNKDLTKFKRFEPTEDSLRSLFSSRLPAFSLDTLELYAMAYMVQYRSSIEQNVPYLDKQLKAVLMPPTIENEHIFTFMLETRAYPFVTKYMSLGCEYFPRNYHISGLQGKFRKVALVNYYGNKIWYWNCSDSRNDNEQLGVIPEIKRRLMAVTDVILIGHSVDLDVKVLGLEQEIPKERRIDMAKKFYHVEQSKYAEGSLYCPTVSCYYYLGLEIQKTDDHNPEEDAKAAMALYRWMEASMDSKTFFPLPERGIDEDNKPEKTIN